MSIDGHQLINDKGQDTRKPSGLTMTQNTGRGQIRKKSILIEDEGSTFIARYVGTI